MDRSTLDVTTWEPPVAEFSCGNRRDLPKRERRHDWLDAGDDVRHHGSGYFLLSKIRICSRCGRDSATPLE